MCVARCPEAVTRTQVQSVIRSTHQALGCREVAFQNFEWLMESQPPTRAQRNLIDELDKARRIMPQMVTNERVAHEIIFELPKEDQCTVEKTVDH
jgi:hypothetical protein